jgi:hypothetical protein|nr:MAG: hypothetical protein [Lake Baikal virophage 3]
MYKAKYPEHFTEPTVKVLTLLSLSGDPEILGSASDRLVLYSADIDAIDTSQWKPEYPRIIRERLRLLGKMSNVRIGDIKGGIVPEWNILSNGHFTKGKVLGYNAYESREKVSNLFSRKIITKEEYDQALKLLVPHPSGLEFLVAQKELRFGIVRWTPKDIAVGFVKLRDGTTLSLENAMLQPTIFKIDLVFWDNERFIDCEMLYRFKIKSRIIAEDNPEAIRKNIKESMLIFASQQNWMKVAKRMYLLAKADDAVTIQENLRDKIFNSDFGRLYGILSDAETLSILTEEGVTEEEKKHIHQEKDAMRERLSKITLPAFLKPLDPFSKVFIDTIQKHLHPGIKKVLLDIKLIPFPKKWVP